MALKVDTPEKLVEHGARVFDGIEPQLEKMHGRALELIDVADKAGEFLLVGALQRGKLKGQAMEAAGTIGLALKQIYQLHRDLTDVAIKHEIDIPSTRDGGGR